MLYFCAAKLPCLLICVETYDYDPTDDCDIACPVTHPGPKALQYDEMACMVSSIAGAYSLLHIFDLGTNPGLIIYPKKSKYIKMVSHK